MRSDSENKSIEFTQEMLAAMGGPNLVYVRLVDADELQGHVPEELLQGSEIFYAVHAADGTRMAVLNDRDAAFITARQNNMVPVSVH